MVAVRKSGAEGSPAISEEIVMPLVLQNATLSGNQAAGEQATGEDPNLLNFTKVMLGTDHDTSSANGDDAVDAADLAVWRSSYGSATDSAASSLGRAEIYFVEVADGAPGAHSSGVNAVLLDGSVRTVSLQDSGVSFFAFEAGFRGGVDVPTSAEADTQFDMQGRLLLGTEGGIWSDDGFAFQTSDASDASINGSLGDGSVRPIKSSDADTAGQSVTFTATVGSSGGADASGDTSGRQLDAFVVTFDRPVDPASTGCGGASCNGGDAGFLFGSGGDGAHLDGDVFDFRAAEAASGTPLASVTDLIIDPFNSQAGHGEMHDLLLANQGHSDGGKFVYLYYTATTPAPASEFDGGSLSTIDMGGIPVTMAEYGLMLA
jgi:prepilin-type processing-associated H-X9-DG protein